MKKTVFGLLGIVMVLAFGACNNDAEKVRDFAKGFAQAVAQNYTVALKAMIYGGRQLSFAHFGMTKLDVSQAVMTKLDDLDQQLASQRSLMTQPQAAAFASLHKARLAFYASLQ